MNAIYSNIVIHNFTPTAPESGYSRHSFRDIVNGGANQFKYDGEFVRNKFKDDFEDIERDSDRIKGHKRGLEQLQSDFVKKLKERSKKSFDTWGRWAQRTVGISRGPIKKEFEGMLFDENTPVSTIYKKASEIRDQLEYNGKSLQTRYGRDFEVIQKEFERIANLEATKDEEEAKLKEKIKTDLSNFMGKREFLRGPMGHYFSYNGIATISEEFRKIAFEDFGKCYKGQSGDHQIELIIPEDESSPVKIRTVHNLKFTQYSVAPTDAETLKNLNELFEKTGQPKENQAYFIANCGESTTPRKPFRVQLRGTLTILSPDRVMAEIRSQVFQ